MSSQSDGASSPPPQPGRGVPAHNGGEAPAHAPPRQGPDTAAWRSKLGSLCADIRQGVRRALLEVAEGEAARGDVADVVGMGSGDVTFALDGIAERAVDRWLSEVAAQGPLSLLTEDTGWRHLGPGANGGPPESLDGFDHGGPRIALDPIDGTRNIMHDLRSAWIVVSFAGPGKDEPRYRDLSLGMLSEIPDTRGAKAREMDAERGGGAFVRQLPGGERKPLGSDADGRLDRGYFPFFGYSPAGRRASQDLCATVFEDLAEEHGLDVSTVLDDQYISSGGQLALLALGTYRAIVDARISLNAKHSLGIQTAKPYDMAGAVLIAIEAGCVVTRPDGEALDFPIDTATEVEFAGYRNPETARAFTEAIVRRLR